MTPFDRLGCILLEIGLWQPLVSLASKRSSETPAVFRDNILSITGRELPQQMGRFYAEAVRKCLSVDARMREGDEQRLCWEILGDVARCVV